ncbi:haloalkane dehalogenase [Paenibacillus sp. MMS20-IR301]|uniref:haloalkane dehalogenase n=1 Tax=Paenibacillus sp. MMS20-IR301 TaxID=2895946 RepID=UPI0028E9B443|nr:haloalkane dehalogenase [Paenibacillus sp. MMS20-IR301]WNS46278.1 haloalkane dehalogenase [Paenibacillus sp. MMS20-IR301]
MTNTNPEEFVLRTDFPFESHYQEVNGHRLHYIDQGKGDPILFLHGNPTSSYTWRNIIPRLEGYGRCIAVDLMGMGRSDKPGTGYSFLVQAGYIEQFIEKLKLSRLTIVGHDWGAAIGLHYAMRHQDKIRGIALLEPQALRPCADWSEFSPPEAVELFQQLRDPGQGWPFMRDNNVFIEGMLHTVINRKISMEELEHYREPFLDPQTRKPLWVFPNQIPVFGQPSEVVQAVEERNLWFTAAAVPKLLLYADPGCNVREPQVNWCREHLPNLTAQSVGTGFHHLAEEQPQAVIACLSEWLQRME